MKWMLSIVLLSGLAFSTVQSQAQQSRVTVQFKSVGCGFFGGLYAKVIGERRNVDISKNGMRCKDAKAALLAAIRAGGNNFEADVHLTSEVREECRRDDDDDDNGRFGRRCEYYRITYKVFQIPNLVFNNGSFWGRSWVSKRRIR
jgi:hypothetical protein